MAKGKKYTLHPYTVFTALAIGGISTCFLGLSISFIYSRIQGQIPTIDLPVLFYFNTLLLLFSSWAFVKAFGYYHADDARRFLRTIGVALALSVFFLVAQLFA